MIFETSLQEEGILKPGMIQDFVGEIYCAQKFFRNQILGPR